MMTAPSPPRSTTTWTAMLSPCSTSMVIGSGIVVVSDVRVVLRIVGVVHADLHVDDALVGGEQLGAHRLADLLDGDLLPGLALQQRLHHAPERGDLLLQRVHLAFDADDAPVAPVGVPPDPLQRVPPRGAPAVRVAAAGGPRVLLGARVGGAVQSPVAGALHVRAGAAVLVGVAGVQQRPTQSVGVAAGRGDCVLDAVLAVLVHVGLDLLVETHATASVHDLLGAGQDGRELRDTPVARAHLAAVLGPHLAAGHAA